MSSSRNRLSRLLKPSAVAGRICVQVGESCVICLDILLIIFYEVFELDCEYHLFVTMNWFSFNLFRIDNHEM